MVAGIEIWAGKSGAPTTFSYLFLTPAYKVTYRRLLDGDPYLTAFFSNVSSHQDLAARIEKLEANQDQHASVINILAEEIDNLKLLPPEPPRKRIGFAADDREGE